jgi:CRISPR/Cas system CSM-associated protein Csm4 (group 5 of RAMP superfamily)
MMTTKLTIGATDEYKKTANHYNRGDGVATTIMAIISLEMRVVSDFFQALSDLVGPKYEESKKKGADYVRAAQETANNYKQVGQEKLNDLTSQGQQQADELSKYGQEKTDQAKATADKKKEEAKGQAQGAKEEAKKAAGQK